MDQIISRTIVALDPSLQAEVQALARRYGRANSGLMRRLNGFGSAVEGRLEALPSPVRHRALQLTEGALRASYGVARVGGRLGPLGGVGHRALGGISGAVGGFGGLATAVAELPVTITLILRAIQEVAQNHGFDPKDEATRREVLQVFAAGTPMADDDGVNTAFLGARLSLTGPAINGMIAGLAPKILAALGPKIAAQAVPLLGAVAGATLNVAYVGYFRELAEIRFRLLALAQTHDPEAVAQAFAQAMAGQAR